MTKDFFGDIGDIFGSEDLGIFNTDVSTILGKNIVLNFLCKINLEVRMFGYSDTANEVAVYYQDCKENGKLFAFFSNPVLKMILEKVETMPVVKNYLDERFFDDIEQEKIEYLNNLYSNNEQISKDINKSENEYNLSQEYKKREIKKIQKEFSCTLEEAEQKYIQQNSGIDCKNFDPINAYLTAFGQSIPYKTWSIDTSKEIDLTEPVEKEDKKTDVDNFWN